MLSEEALNTINVISFHNKRRNDFMRAQIKLQQQCHAICRRNCGGDKKKGKALLEAIWPGDKNLPLLVEMAKELDTVEQYARELAEQVAKKKKFDADMVYMVFMNCYPFFQGMLPLIQSRDYHEKFLEKEAKHLPVWSWAKEVKGLGALSLAKIVAETTNTGDNGETRTLSNYDNPAKVWKRMGLGLVNGEVQRRTLDKEKAIEMAFAPHRRAVMHVIGENLIRAKGPLYDIYLERKRLEYQKAVEAGLIPVSYGQDTIDSWEEKGFKLVLIDEEKYDKKKHMSAKHMHIRAMRYISKRLLRELWVAWNQVG